MPGRIIPDGKGFIVQAWHEGEPPAVPIGYRELGTNEKVVVGDLAFNVIGQRWEPISEATLMVAELFGNPHKIARFPLIRLIR